MLQHLGYTVLEAGNGKEAVEIYRENKDRIDLVILDMIMPGLGGGAVYDCIKEINDSARVLLSSGYSVEGEAQKILERGCNGFIQKPFRLQGLSEKISAILGKG
jgi:CheY-like chemotaxis protein